MGGQYFHHNCTLVYCDDRRVTQVYRKPKFTFRVEVLDILKTNSIINSHFHGHCYINKQIKLHFPPKKNSIVTVPGGK